MPRGKAKTWTPEEIERFKEDWVAGVPNWRLSEIYGCGYQAIRFLVARLGLHKRTSADVTRRRRFRRSEIPKTGSPVVKALRRLMNDEQASLGEVSKRSGIDKSAISSWGKVDPKLSNLEAVGNSIGYKLVWSKRTGNNKKLPQRQEDGTYE